MLEVKWCQNWLQAIAEVYFLFSRVNIHVIGKKISWQEAFTSKHVSNMLLNGWSWILIVSYSSSSVVSDCSEMYIVGKLLMAWLVSTLPLAVTNIFVAFVDE
jgi:hypothetical protein